MPTPLEGAGAGEHAYADWPAFTAVVLALCAGVPATGSAQAARATRTIAPESMHFAKVENATAAVVTYHGRPGIRLESTANAAMAMDSMSMAQQRDMLAILDGSDLRDGTIEIDVAGAPHAGSSPGARGFIGIAFRVAASGDQSEVFYLRPTNGRADDQLRRNHSVQYISNPDYPWQRLRSESPGVYESYVDLEPGEWTRMKIVISGTTARLYVNGANQPCLIVSDLKRGAVSGRIGLWANSETDAYFGTITFSTP